MLTLFIGAFVVAGILQIARINYRSHRILK